MNKKKRYWYLIGTLLLIILLAAGILAEIHTIQANRNRQPAPDSRKSVSENQPAGMAGEYKQEKNTEESTVPPKQYQDLETIDFDKLQKQNPDVYAWIQIPGTRIDYPVLQSASDDTYYLKYNLDGSKGYPGCIYSEKANAKDFSDFETVLYGHNMKNGSMFHDLHLYQKKDFYEEHNTVYIYQPGRVLVYTVFAAYAYDDRHILNSFDFTRTDVREAYLSGMQQENAGGIYGREGISVSADSRILTLSTCEGGRPDQRFLVQTVLTDEIK